MLVRRYKHTMNLSGVAAGKYDVAVTALAGASTTLVIAGFLRALGPALSLIPKSS